MLNLVEFAQNGIGLVYQFLIFSEIKLLVRNSSSK